MHPRTQLFSIVILLALAWSAHAQNTAASPRVALLGPATGTADAGQLATSAAQLLGADAVLSFESTDAANVTDCSEPGVHEVTGMSVVRWDPAPLTPDRIDLLGAVLAEARGPTVLVAIDDPDWASPSVSEAWARVHARLRSDPRVRAVIAVASGIARDDGERDGIHYLALPPRSGTGPRGLDQFSEPAVVFATSAGDSLRFSLVNPEAVRSMASIPGGAVDDAIALRDAVSVSGRFEASPSGGPAGRVTVRLHNPTSRAVRYALVIDPPEGWAFSRDEISGTLTEGASESIEITAESPQLTSRPTLELRGLLRMPIDDNASQAIPVRLEVPVVPAVGAAQSAATDPVGGTAFRTDGRSGLQLEMGPLSAPFTIECWVNADEVTGEAVLLSMGELQVFWSGATDLEPQPVAVLPNGTSEHIVLRAGSPAPIERWTHLALCVGERDSTLYINGEPAATATFPGNFELRSPLVLGGVLDPYNRVRTGFAGEFDELRVSSVVRYESPFTPTRVHASDARALALLHFDRDLGPAMADDSPRHAHGWSVGSPTYSPAAGSARAAAESPEP